MASAACASGKRGIGGDGALQPVAGGQRVELVQPLEALGVEPRRVDVGWL